MDIGIDLGTANIVIAMGTRGIVLNEPSVIAYNKKTDRVVAVGFEAYQMLGKTPRHIDAMCPLADGVISDDVMTQCMIKEFIIKVCGKQFTKPRIVICVPSFITDVDKKAIIETALHAGARKVYLIEEPIAALIGAGIDIAEANGHIVVDIGGGTSDVAVVSLGGVVNCNSIKVGGNKINRAIVKYVLNKYRMSIGEKTAEDVKIELTNVFDPNPKNTYTIKGQDLTKGLPMQMQLTEVDIAEAIQEQVTDIIDAIHTVLDSTPPELIGDIYDNGILLTGGGALLGGLPELIQKTLNVKCKSADDPLLCVAKGTGLAFRYTDMLLDGFQNVSLGKYR
jgi:rod shape-determining protein MreB